MGGGSGDPGDMGSSRSMSSSSISGVRGLGGWWSSDDCDAKEVVRERLRMMNPITSTRSRGEALTQICSSPRTRVAAGMAILCRRRQYMFTLCLGFLFLDSKVISVLTGLLSVPFCL